MKKTILYLAAALTLAACSSNDEEPISNNDNQEVTLTFSNFEMEMSTRATLSDASLTHLDIWINDGTTTTDYHQVSTDEVFGSLSLSLNKTKTYTLYAIAHKASGACTLADGVIAFPDDKPKESFYYTTTFTPASTTTLNCEMSRVCGKFTLVTTDVVPEDVDHVLFVIANTATRLAVNGTPANSVNREVSFSSISRKPDGTCSFAFQILSTSAASTNFTITATAYDAQDDIVETKTFTDIPIRNNYKTTLSGMFFVTTNVGINLSTVDWYDEENIDF